MTLLYYILENRQVTDTYLTNRGDPETKASSGSGGQGVLWGRTVHLVGWREPKGDRRLCLSADRCDGGRRLLPSGIPHAKGERDQLLPEGPQQQHGLGTIKLPSTVLEIIGRLWGRADTRRMALIEYSYTPVCSSSPALTRASSTAPIRCAPWWPTGDSDTSLACGTSIPPAYCRFQYAIHSRMTSMMWPQRERAGRGPRPMKERRRTSASEAGQTTCDQSGSCRGPRGRTQWKAKK